MTAGPVTAAIHPVDRGLPPVGRHGRARLVIAVVQVVAPERLPQTLRLVVQLGDPSFQRVLLRNIM